MDALARSEARADALEAENDRLRGRIEQLEGAMGMDFLPPLDWRLTGTEARVLGVLLAREMATKDAIMAGLYRNGGGADADEPEIKIVDVYICKLRAKLKPFGLGVETIWGRGYRLTPAVKAAVRAAVEAVAA